MFADTSHLLCLQETFRGEAWLSTTTALCQKLYLLKILGSEPLNGSPIPHLAFIPAIWMRPSSSEADGHPWTQMLSSQGFLILLTTQMKSPSDRA